MRRRNARGTGQRGLTMLEALIALLVSGVLGLAVSQFLSSYFALQSGSIAAHSAREELAGLLSTVEAEWKSRIQPDAASFITTASPAFTGGTPPCQDLKITQRDDQTQALRTVEFLTTCTATPHDPKGSLAHPRVTCPSGQTTKVSVVRDSGTDSYPVSQQTLGTALCFRVSVVGTNIEISAEGGSITKAGTRENTVADRRVLTNNDRSAGIEYTK